MHTDDSQVVARRADWENFIDHVAKLIIQEQTPDRLLLIRSKLYELLTNCIPPDVVLRTLVAVLLRRVDDQIKTEIVHWAAYYDHRMELGSKPIFHLEAFVAKFMAMSDKQTTQRTRIITAALCCACRLLTAVCLVVCVMCLGLCLCCVRYKRFLVENFG